MKVVYGTGKTALMVGVDKLGDGYAPFLGFVEAENIKDMEPKNFGKMAVDEVSAVVEKSGGVMIYIENQEAAETLMRMLMVLFHNVVDTSWGGTTEAEGVMQ